MKPAKSVDVELANLLTIFFRDDAALGVFEQVEASDLPENERSLLAHNAHMTVTLEDFHQSPVSVRVLETHGSREAYSRKIELTRQSDDRVVQFGIVRLDLTVLAPEVRKEIESKRIPLGRVLIDHDVMREVKLQHLYRISAGEILAQSFGVEPGTAVYGRTAMIWCNGSPAIELLEIVGNCWDRQHS